MIIFLKFKLCRLLRYDYIKEIFQIHEYGMCSVSIEIRPVSVKINAKISRYSIGDATVFNFN